MIVLLGIESKIEYGENLILAVFKNHWKMVSMQFYLGNSKIESHFAVTK